MTFRMAPVWIIATADSQEQLPQDDEGHVGIVCHEVAIELI